VHPAALVASASLDGSVGVWNASSGARIAVLEDATCVVKAVAFSPDGTRLAASSYDGRVRVYETGGFRIVAEHFAQNLWNRSLAWTEQVRHRQLRRRSSVVPGRGVAPLGPRRPRA
jgi:WD40 repeat protein